MSLLEIIPAWIRETPDNLKTQEMCNETMHIDPYSSALVPDSFKTQKMCDKAIEIDPFTLLHVPDNLRTQGMCIRTVEAVLGLLEYVQDWFVTQQQKKYGVMTMSIAMMMNLLSGTMVIRLGRLKKQK